MNCNCGAELVVSVLESCFICINPLCERFLEQPVKPRDSKRDGLGHLLKQLDEFNTVMASGGWKKWRPAGPVYCKRCQAVFGPEPGLEIWEYVFDGAVFGLCKACEAVVRSKIQLSDAIVIRQFVEMMRDERR